MKRCTLLFALACLSSPLLLAQPHETIFGQHGFALSGIWGSVTKNYSFYDDDRAFHNGGTIGLEFGRSLFLGYAWSKARQDIPAGDGFGSYRLRQRNAVLSVTPAAHQALHPVLSFQAGSGRIELDDGSSDRVFVLQPSAGVELNIFSFFRVGVEGGYRFITDNDLPRLGDTALSSPFAQVNLRFGISWGSSCR